MRGRNPSADSAAGIAGRRRSRLPTAMPGRGLGAEPPIAKQHSYSGGNSGKSRGFGGIAPKQRCCVATSCFTASVALELGGGKISERGVKPLAVIDALQKFSNAGAGVVEIAVFVAVNLFLFQGFQE